MNLGISSSLLVFLLVLASLSSATVEGFRDGVTRINQLDKVGVGVKERELLILDAVLDYDYAGPNPKHDPRGRRSGNGGGKNP